MTANDVMSVAASYVGTKESPSGSNNVVFNTDYYGKQVSGNDYPWCMAFVWDIFRLAGAPELCTKTAYCPTYEAWAISKAWTVRKDEGRYGDVATMDFGKGRASHVGFIVQKNADGTYETIEGNTSETSQDNGGAVMRRTRPQSVIRYIFRPTYGAEMGKINFTTPQLTNAVANVYKMAHDQRFMYGDSHTLPPCADRIISCDRLIARALWDLGMTDQPRGGITVLNMDAWLVSHGFEKVTSMASLRGGEIILMAKDGQSTPTPFWHAFYILSYNTATSRCDKYDLGSQTRIQAVQPYKNVLLDEWNDRHFYAGYRVPGNTGYLSQDSAEFDYEVYAGLWADLLKAFGWNREKLLNHWHTFGMKEGRRANCMFDPQYYKKKYADLQKAFDNRWTDYFDHFYLHGMKEGRRASEIFDVKFYKNRYPDLQKAFGNDWTRYFNHFISNGMKEGRESSEEFDPKAYKKRYPDLAKAFGDDWSAYYRHYVIHGKKEGRKGR